MRKEFEMSEDRLEKALDAMKNESVGADAVALAKERVREKMEKTGMLVSPEKNLCAGFRDQFAPYLEGRLNASRHLLMDDHLSRCADCRGALSEYKHGLKRSASRPVLPAPIAFRQRKLISATWGKWAAAAAVLLAVFYFGYRHLDPLPSRGVQATVHAVHGTLHLLPEGVIETGAEIAANRTVRTGAGSRAVLRLADGSIVNVNERTELSIRAVRGGRMIALERGDVIIEATKQRKGHLRVQTRDSLASVKGTVFAVSSGLNGSLVSVVEGSVAVKHPWAEEILGPGQQASSNPALISSVQEAIAWSPDAESYVALLASLIDLEKQVAGLPFPRLRAESALLPLMPENTVVYGAVPNMGEALNSALTLMTAQAAENPAFSRWWDSGAGHSLGVLIDRVRAVSSKLGDEIVFGLSFTIDSTIDRVEWDGIPFILAGIQPGKRAELAAMLEDADFPGSSAYDITGELLVVSDSSAHLGWLLPHLGLGAGTPFAAEIAAHYRQATGWLLGIDTETITSSMQGAGQIRYLFMEQQHIGGTEESKMSIRFQGPRRGLASFLANTGSSGAAEYLSENVIAAISASTHEPRLVIDMMKDIIAAKGPDIPDNRAGEKDALGLIFVDELAAHFGTETAFGIENISLKGPAWVLAALIHNPSAFESSVRRLAESFNMKAATNGQPPLISLTAEVANGRTWTTLTFTHKSISITWTYDRGYMVAASDRGTAMRALATRNTGLPLVWSDSFLRQLPASIGLHPSGFLWLNTRGASQWLAPFISNQELLALAAQRDPVLFVANADTEHIRVASRTSLSGFFIDLMLLQGLGQAGSQSVIQ
jgi:hypothetical protein